MYTFEITVNDERRVVAGADDLAVLSTIISLHGALGRSTYLTPQQERRGLQLSLGVTGLSHSGPVRPAEHRRWVERCLQPGDTVRIALVDQPRADPALRDAPEPTPEQQQREHYDWCKKMYHGQKALYEEGGAALARAMQHDARPGAHRPGAAAGMYVVKIGLNDEAPVAAGAHDLCGVHVFVCCDRLPGPHAPRAGTDHGAGWLTVSGLASAMPGPVRQHLDWVTQRDLRVGDVVTVQLAEASHADPAIDSRLAQPWPDERAQFEQCKEFYLALKDQYEAA